LFYCSTKKTKPLKELSSLPGQIKFSKNRRIAFICFSSSYGGLELSMLKLASEFNQRQAECIVIVQPDTPLANHAWENKLNKVLLKTNLKYGDIAASIRLARIFKSHKIDVAIVMQSKDISIVTVAQVLFSNTKLVFYQEMQSGIDKRDILHSWMYSKLALWITLTNRMKQDVIKHTRVPADRINVNPIGTDMSRFNPNLYNRTKARKLFNMPDTKFIIGALGRLDPQKGQEEFIRVIPILLSYRSDLYFVIAGDETPGQVGFKKSLLCLSQELGVTDHLRFLPFTDAVPEFLSAIDIFVLPSHSETFGFVLVEAMAMGKPIVATYAGGVPEIITDNSTGLLVPPCDVQSLAKALRKLVIDPKLCSLFSKKARNDALMRFDIARCIDQLSLSLDAL
jgi:glycosyltransferase involved in cell wall biosynthesis